MKEEKEALPLKELSDSGLYLTKEEKEFFDNLNDWRWRIKNLYYITDKHGRKIKFWPNWAQDSILDGLWFFMIILKARQLGITTFFSILYLDQILFNSNKSAAIIAHTDKDTKKIFGKIKFAWDNLPTLLQENLGLPKTETVGELSFPNGSKIFVARSTRGDSLQFLHVSEFAKICAKYPEKAKEIVTGAINSVEQGNFVSIESTAEGKEGYFFDFCTEAQKAMLSGKKLSPMEFKFFFFPWWKELSYRTKGDFPISVEMQNYFDKLEAVNKISLDDEQKRWYITKKNIQGEDMFAEFPSTPEEAFSASVEGAYYSEQMKQVHKDQRIRNVPYDSRYPVDTIWDLGYNDANIILFFQNVGNEIRFIDCYGNSGEGLGHYVGILRDRGYNYGINYMPHDIEVHSLDADGTSRRKTLMDLGVRNIRTIEKTKDINDDIEGVRKIFSRFYFDETKCQPLISACQNYRHEWDDKNGVWKDRPKHDKNSNWVDPLRLLVKANLNNMIDDKNNNSVKISNFF